METWKGDLTELLGPYLRTVETGSV